MNNTHNVVKKTSEGFVLMSGAIIIFVILSIFSLFLLRVVVNGNSISAYNLLDGKTRNLAVSGLEHGVQLFKNNGFFTNNIIQKNLGDGSYNIRFDSNNDYNGNSLPYTHYTMLSSSASIGEVERKTRLFVSAYPDAFNLSFFSRSNTFSHSGTTFNDDIYSNGNISTISISGTAYTSTGTGGIQHPSPPPSFPEYSSGYFENLISTVPSETVNYWPVTFSNCGATGRLGPNQTQINNAYAGSALSGNVISNNGIQTWTVPETGQFTIKVYGASGGYGGSTTDNGGAGKGARMVGTFNLNQGDILNIIVGQEGISNGHWAGGGGGGSFVIRNGAPLIIAGGGAGGGKIGGYAWVIHGATSQNAGSGQYGGTGGTNGNGATGSNIRGGNAGGYYSNGSGSQNFHGEIGTAYVNGGYGGNAYHGSQGGFGGGGGSYGAAGGGGGYSGGGGGAHNSGKEFAGGGGGSFNVGSDQDNTFSYNLGHGKVAIGPPESFGSDQNGSDILSFNNLSASGRYGPSNTNGYNGSKLQGQVSLVNGIQIWTVPVTGSYTIKASGASGGNGATYAVGNPGMGAFIEGTFYLNAGTKLCILVGQQGSYTSYSNYYGGGGGGGSFVGIGGGPGGSGYALATPLIVAGGGGGGGYNSGNNTHGQTTINGSNGSAGTYSTQVGIGGQNGYGATGSVFGGNAGGFYSNGSGNYNYNGEIGLGFRQGGAGGNGRYGGRGGFGGGAGGYGGAGGGGGYSGGGGGAWHYGGAGGGGGSHAQNGSNIIRFSNHRNGHGFVQIITPEIIPPPETAGPISNTETGTINLNGNSITYGSNVTFNDVSINGTGKIIGSENIFIDNTSTISGGIEIISGGTITVQESVIGSGVNTLLNSITLYARNGLIIENSSTVRGLSIISGGTTSIINANYLGALLHDGGYFSISNSTITGSVVSKSGLNIVNSSITKGDLPPIYGTPYGLEGMVIPGSYLEY